MDYYDIIATLGPSSRTKSIWERMVSAGVTGFRLNTSHLTQAQLASWLEELQPFLDSILKKHRGKTVLISGHSDDVPAMLAMLRKEWDGGKGVALIPKPVYDNLYIIFVPATGNVSVLNLKYGQRTP